MPDEKSNANETAGINIVVDAQKLSWKEFLQVSGVEESEPGFAGYALNKMIVNKEEVEDLPFLEVYQALQNVLEQEFKALANPKN